MCSVLRCGVKVERATTTTAAAVKGAPPGRISHAGAGGGGGGAQEDRTILKGITGEVRPREVLAEDEEEDDELLMEMASDDELLFLNGIHVAGRASSSAHRRHRSLPEADAPHT
uniref:Uncharacterized protein n=1 Tax=Oryza glumipatula TaxID=40148 RepID=A0A0D9ZYE7_9ORYZ